MISSSVKDPWLNGMRIVRAIGKIGGVPAQRALKEVCYEEATHDSAAYHEAKRWREPEK